MSKLDLARELLNEANIRIVDLNTLNRMSPGTRIFVIDQRDRSTHEYCILGAPYVGDSIILPPKPSRMGLAYIDVMFGNQRENYTLRGIRTGKVKRNHKDTLALADIGIMPYPKGHMNQRKFTVTRSY